MPATTHRIRVVLALAAACILSGCGGGKEESVALPAPVAKPPAEVGPAAGNAAPAPALGAPTADGAPPPPGQGAPPPTPTGPADVFSGMSPKEIDEFKKRATPETHDMNIDQVSEAVRGFFSEFGRAPTTVEQLYKARYLPSVLPAPKGKKYVIDPKTLAVTTENL